MAFCTNCGAELRDNPDLCPVCGDSVHETSTSSFVQPDNFKQKYEQFAHDRKISVRKFWIKATRVIAWVTGAIIALSGLIFFTSTIGKFGDNIILFPTEFFISLIVLLTSLIIAFIFVVFLMLIAGAAEDLSDSNEELYKIKKKLDKLNDK